VVPDSRASLPQVGSPSHPPKRDKLDWTPFWTLSNRTAAWPNSSLATASHTKHRTIT